MSTGTNIFTSRGLTKIRDAAGSGSQVKIKYIALGDGQGAGYAPSASQTALRHERLRNEIERHYPVGPNAWHVKASFPPETTQITVREIGFLDEDGDLIALWAGLDVGDARKTGTIEYLINHVIAFDGIADGVVIMSAPLDEYVDHAVLKLRTDALIIDRQLAQCKQLRDLKRAA
jgi:hypothetical protein